MTKRIIDVDIVERILTNAIKRSTYNIMGVEYDIDKAVFVNILHKIEELATAETQEISTKANDHNYLLDVNDISVVNIPQESIFDADGWCRDMKSMPMGEDVLLLVSCENEWYRTVGRQYSKQHDIEHDLSLSWSNCDFYELAWRPLPNLPYTDTAKNLNKGE